LSEQRSYQGIKIPLFRIVEIKVKEHQCSPWQLLAIVYQLLDSRGAEAHRQPVSSFGKNIQTREQFSHSSLQQPFNKQPEPNGRIDLRIPYNDRKDFGLGIQFSYLLLFINQVPVSIWLFLLFVKWLP
jgi:hypothetical protein